MERRGPRRGPGGHPLRQGRPDRAAGDARAPTMAGGRQAPSRAHRAAANHRTFYSSQLPQGERVMSMKTEVEGLRHDVEDEREEFKRLTAGLRTRAHLSRAAVAA